MYGVRVCLVIAVFFIVFISGCENSTHSDQTAALRGAANFDLESKRTAWLRNHLPNNTIAYVNFPTPWNYLFDAKADAMHAVQSLPAHIEQVEKIKQGVKDSYFQYVPTEYQGLTAMLFEHTQTSLEFAVINNSPSAFLPTFAVGTRLSSITHAALIEQLNTLLSDVDPNMILEQVDKTPLWTFKVNQFPAFLQYDESNGQLLVYGGMGANQQKMTEIWTQKSGEQLAKIQTMSQQADPSGLNMKMWVAAAKMYRMGQAFLPPDQQQVVTEFGLDQMDYIWLGFESNQGQSALAMHVIMPETGWRLMLPRATDWFDVQMAGEPRSVIQMTLPTSDQVKQIIEKYNLADKLTDKDREDMKVWKEIGTEIGFDFYDILDAYHQQFIMVKDQSGSWFAMKTKNKKLRADLEKSINEYFKIETSAKQLDGVEIMQAHFSIYEKLFSQQKDLPADAEQIQKFLSVFKEHAFWYEEEDVIYMSQVPQVLAMKKKHSQQLSLASWLKKNQGGDWNSAILAYGKDVKHMPQDLYHYYLLLLQGLGDLAQVEVDLFALPTADQLNLPDAGRINLVLSSDAEKVSFRFGYEYSVLEPILSSEGGVTTLAVLGILAAYAIPAYNDYTVRAKLGSQMALASTLKMVVAERLLSEEYTTEDLFAGIEEEVSIEGLNYYIDIETNTIVIDLEGVDTAFEAGDEIYYEPSVENGYVDWYCYSNIRQSYLPAGCRD